jgi:hypothetical protein
LARTGLLLRTLAILSTSLPALAGAPILRGNGSQFTLLRPANPAPATQFLTADGTPVDLDRLRGNVVPLNF